jgi:hypothetical protein
MDQEFELSTADRFEMTPYLPDDDQTGPPQVYPYDDLRRRNILRKDGTFPTRPSVSGAD